MIARKECCARTSSRLLEEEQDFPKKVCGVGGHVI